MRGVMTFAMGMTLTAALAGCSSEPRSDPQNNAAAAAPRESGYIARVTALPAGQLRGVLFRAVADAGRGCQAIQDYSREADRKGKPVWSARCSDGSVWMVALSDDGVAQVTGVPGPR